jgi:hypothetical protein
VFFAAQGVRDLDHGKEKIENEAERVQVKKQAGQVLAKTALCTVVSVSILLLLP